MGIDTQDCESVRKALLAAGIKQLDSHAYTLYECGHAFDVIDDPSKVNWYAERKRSLRSCPKCIKQKLLTKFKRCKCGKEHLGLKVQASIGCNFCPPEEKTPVAGRFAYRKNGHLADHDRGFCVHKSVCLVRYIDYDTVPCKDCDDFFVLQGAHDPLAEKISG